MNMRNLIHSNKMSLPIYIYIYILVVHMHGCDIVQVFTLKKMK